MEIFKKGMSFAGMGKWILLTGLLHDLRAVEMFVLLSVVRNSNLAFSF